MSNLQLQPETGRSLVKESLLEIRRLREQIDHDHRARTEPIAIVGIGCRLPGAANGPEAFWQSLLEGRDAIAEISKDRWTDGGMAADQLALHDLASIRLAGCLDQVDRFDTKFFNIHEQEAESMDPQQRLLLEVVWEALENGAIVPATLRGTKTGVFVGLGNSDYQRKILADHRRFDPYSGTGGMYSVAAGRLSYLFELRGPAMALDTACSSSLVAVHLASQSLKNGESELAVAAGVNLIVSPVTGLALSRGGMLSPEGKC